MLSNVSNKVEVTKMPPVTASLSGSSVSISGTPNTNIKSFDTEAIPPMRFNVGVRVYPDTNNQTLYIDRPMYIKLSGTISKANMIIFFGGMFIPYLSSGHGTRVEVFLVNSAGTKVYYHEIYANLHNDLPNIVSYTTAEQNISL